MQTVDLKYNVPVCVAKNLKTSCHLRTAAECRWLIGSGSCGTFFASFMIHCRCENSAATLFTRIPRVLQLSSALLSKSMPDLISNKKSWRAHSSKSASPQPAAAPSRCCCCCVSFSPLTFHFPVHLSVGERGDGARNQSMCSVAFVSAVALFCSGGAALVAACLPPRYVGGRAAVVAATAAVRRLRRRHKSRSAHNTLRKKAARR